MGKDANRSDANIYSADPGFDRASGLRSDADFIARALADPASRGVPVWRGSSLITSDEAPRAIFIALPDMQGVDLGRSVFLGQRDGTNFFQVDISALTEAEAQIFADALGGKFVDLRTVGGLLPRNEAALLAYARGLGHWHGRQRHCGVCGAPTIIASAGHVRVCSDPACATHHFPRTDPATIMLIEHQGRALLGRQRHWAPGMYSTLAGFVEPGESLEDAVRREVREESGVVVGRVVYHSSQPWPFPQSLMLGFYGVALTEEIMGLDDELEDVQWFSADEIRQFATVGKFLPRADSIARRLIETWLDGQSPL